MDTLLNGLCANASCPNQENGEDVVSSAPIIFFDEEWFGASRRTQMHNLGTELQGKHLRIATLQNYPLSYAQQENGTLVGKGVAFEFVKYLQDKYEFDYSVVVPNEDVLGSNESGIFGMLHNGEADVAAAFLPVIPKYWKFVHYSPSLDMGEWVVLMKRPAESATGSGLLAPFTLEVWLLILASLICVGPAIYFLIRLHKRLCQEELTTNANLYGCFWFVYGALLKQGTTVVPMSDSTRLVFATWWIFITILTAFYTANLTAFLTLSQFTLPVAKPEDIGAKRYSWVTKKGNAINEAATNELESLFVNLRGSTPHYVMDNDGDNILREYVKQKNYLYIGEKPIVEHMMFNDYQNKARLGVLEAERCTYVITGWSVLLRARAFAYSDKFPYRQLFDDTLEHLVESGIVKYKLRDGLPNTSICPLNLGSKERQLRNTDLLLTYYIVAAGFVLSGIIFVAEILIKYFNKPNGKKSGKEQLHFVAAPPPYHTLFKAPFNYENGEKKSINGRDYWVVKSDQGQSNIVPIRTPSALLFQYTH